MKKQLCYRLGVYNSGRSGSFDGFVLHLTEKRLPKASRRRGIPVVPVRSRPRVRVVHLRKIEHSVLMISDNSGHAETYRVLTMVRKEGAPPQQVAHSRRVGPLGCDLAQSVRTDVAVTSLTLFRHPMMLHPAPIPTVAMVMMSVDRVSLSAIISKREGM